MSAPVRRMMRLLGLEAIYRKPRLTVANPEHRVYRYPPRGVTIERSNQEWCADIETSRSRVGWRLCTGRAGGCRAGG